MKNLIFLILICISGLLAAQEPITWDLLADASFESIYDQESGLQVNQVTPGPYLSLFEGKEVVIKGYIIPLDALGVNYVISKSTFASCFFCGKAGPETILQLELKPEAIEKYATDYLGIFRGILNINKTDLKEFNYILRDAEEVKQ